MAARAAKQATTSARRTRASASDPILAAKITAPDVPDWALQRPRITKLITEGTRRCPLTVVSGPPGAGKTLALALWGAAEPGPVAWLSLDEYDNRPGGFWPYVMAALHRSGVGVPKALSAAARGRAAEHKFFLRLAATLSAQNLPVTLVLDDFHLITEPKVLDGLDFVVRNSGPGLRLVICARADPMLSLHRYRLTGELTEIRAADLAFTVAETGLLLAQHGSPLSADSVEALTQRTEGWAAGIRLAAISADTHPDPDQFVKELITRDSALTSFLVDEVLGTQPPEAQHVLLSTSILGHVHPEAACELAGNDQAGRILAALAHANAFVQPVRGGWYRYHTVLAEVLRLKLRHESPALAADLHRRAAWWYQRNGSLTDAVRHAVRAGDWQLAASMAIDGLAVGEIIEPGRGLAAEFADMPADESWNGAQPYLISAAVALATDGPVSFAPALTTAETILGPLPADQSAAGLLAAATIRLAAARRTGDLAAAASAVARAKALVSSLPADVLARHPETRAGLLCDRGTVELWLGHLDEAARILDAAVAAATAAGADQVRAGCLGHLALAAALRGQPGRAADLAARATAARTTGGRCPPAQFANPAALLALAWVRLEHNEVPGASSLLKQVNAALSESPDKLLGAIACLLAAHADLANGHAAAAAQYLAKARYGWSVPAWLEQRLSLAEPGSAAAIGGIQRRRLAPPPATSPARARSAAPARPAAPARSPGPARPPVAGLSHGHRPLLPGGAEQATVPVVVESLTEREQEVLRHLSHMLTTEEVASEMYISTNTVKSHLKSVFRKLGAVHRGEAVRRARQLELI